MSEEQVCKEIIEQVGYQEFYRYFQEKTTLIEQQRKEIERLNKELENLEKLNNANYQSFIEVNNIRNKAIDFLKKNACIDEDVEYFCDDLRYDDCKKLLDILQGSDKE